MKISKLFNDRKEFESLIKKQVNNKPILLDEVGMYEESLLESVRIHSDEFAFVLSSHKMLKLFKKEHFQTRFVASCELKSLDKIELKDYIFKKHNLFFYEKEFRFLRKIYQGNLRNIDKTLQSFKDINGFYKESKSTLYKLRLSAIEQGLL
ncbi:transformation system protein [Campylobacter sp. LR185c]|nr:transformation system protein [Campylobacter sp. LR185c]